MTQHNRVTDDAYMTPLSIAVSIARRVAGFTPSAQRIIEPSAGSGNFVKAIRAAWPKAEIIAVDKRGACRKACEDAGATFVEMDWVEYAHTGDCSADVIIGNPPYADAEAHVRSALMALPRHSHLAFLLRLNFLCGQSRARTLWGHRGLKYIIPLAKRPSFIGGGTDSSEYGVFVWGGGYDGVPQIMLPHIWPAKDIEDREEIDAQSLLPGIPLTLTEIAGLSDEPGDDPDEPAIVG